ncbi:unnamed protein product [Calypogeia fissa]
MEGLQVLRFCLGLLLLCSSMVQIGFCESLEDIPAIQRFREYLRIPTVHPDPDYAPAIEFLTRQAEEIGLPVTIHQLVEYKPILVMTWEGSEPSLKSIMLNSHMDVVQCDLDEWIYDPFAAYMDEDGNIFGRGTQDMKGMAMHYLEAIRILKQKDFKPVRTIHVVFVPDEEIGGEAGWKGFIETAEFRAMNVAIALDEGPISSDNSSYYATWAEKSPWWLIIKAIGPTGHGSVFFDGTALENLFKSVESISRFRESQMLLVKGGEPLGEVVTVNGVFLQAGTKSSTGYTMNIQPAEAEAGFDIRVPPYSEVAEALEKRISEEWAPSSRNLTFWFEQKFETEDGQPPITEIDGSNPWWGLLEKSVGRFNGPLTPEICPASTDMRFLRQKGFSAFGFSAIQGAPVLIHDDNEFVNGWKWLEGIPVYAEVIETYASFSDPDRQADTQDLLKDTQ